MLRAGVIGYPIHHSLSPRLHGFWLKQYGIEGSYVTVEAVPEEFEKKLRELMEKGWRGVNVTLPHKETAAKLVDDGDDIVRTTGAANTLVFEGGKIRGTNTDVYGFIENLRQEAGDLNPYKKHALVLGAGGAARAVCAGLIQEGWERITLANRTRAKSHALADQFDGAIECVGWKQKEEVSADATLLVNTTSQEARRSADRCVGDRHCVQPAANAPVATGRSARQ